MPNQYAKYAKDTWTLYHDFTNRGGSSDLKYSSAPMSVNDLERPCLNDVHQIIPPYPIKKENSLSRQT